MARNGIARYGLAAALLVVGAPAAEAAGLFDDLARALFGGGPRLRASPIYEYDDDQPRLRAPRARVPEISSKPKPPVVQLDPQADKQWHLKDPTLRRGDIVVTAGGVLVYQGRDADASRPSDFVALGGKDSKGWKQQLQMAAAGGRALFSDLSTPAKTAVTAEAAE